MWEKARSRREVKAEQQAKPVRAGLTPVQTGTSATGWEGGGLMQAFRAAPAPPPHCQLPRSQGSRHGRSAGAVTAGGTLQDPEPERKMPVNL